MFRKVYIQENDVNNISLNDIVERFYVNPFYFSQLFRKKTVTTRQKYLTELRMKRRRPITDRSCIR